MEEPLTGWTIYRHPLDYPNHFVVRQWWVVEDDALFFYRIGILCESLDEAREQIPAGALRCPREVADDPVIVETWLP